MTDAFDPGRAFIREISEATAEAVAARMLADYLTKTPSPWLDVEEAAEYIRCKPQRVYDLVSEDKLRPARDGRRLLFRREWLDAYVEGSSAAASARPTDDESPTPAATPRSPFGA